MRLPPRMAMTAGALAAAAIPVAISAAPAGAGPGDHKEAAVEWQYAFTPVGSNTPVTCHFRGDAVLDEFHGIGGIVVLGSSAPPCFSNNDLRVRISYTNRHGERAVVQGGTLSGRNAYVEADDVLDDMTVELRASYSCTAPSCTTSRTLTPK